MSGWSERMRRALLALAAGPALHLPGRGGWAAGDELIPYLTIRALARREAIAITEPRPGWRAARITARGRRIAAALESA